MTLLPRIPLMLPSFLLHVLRRQLKRYSLRSCPGNVWRLSPLSWRRRLRKSLQTLHLPSIPDGDVVLSSHVYNSISTVGERKDNMYGLDILPVDL